MTTRRQRMFALGQIAISLALAVLWVQTAAASSISPLPRSDYTVQAVCARPARGHAGCMALQLVPRTAEARAHTHPIGIARTVRTAPSAASAGDFGLTPQDLHSAYQLPTSAPYAQTIALVDAYNDLTAEEDLATYSKEFGLPECTATSGCFKKVNQDGEATNLPFPQTRAKLTKAETLCQDGGTQRRPTVEEEEACFQVEETGEWGVEISLDIETAHGICQNCDIVLVEADSSEYDDLETAEDSAARLHATEISNSWGGPECSEGVCLNDSPAFNHPGIVITAAAGDDGYLNWLEEPRSGSANFPASSPQVVAVGGTHLNKLGPEGQWAGEAAWNDGGESEGVKEGYGAGGGGCSARFTAQPWQQSVSDWSSVGCGAQRAVSDVAADADPYSGVVVRDTSPYCEYRNEEGEVIQVLHWCVIAGTSLATPLIASTFALAGGANGVEYPARTLYENDAKATPALHDVTEGSNGECLEAFDDKTGLSACTATEEAKSSCDSQAICLAGTGYDGPTGVGTPDGIAAFKPPPGAPTVTTDAVSAITQTSATLGATVNPNGGEVSECKLEYGITASYESSAACSPSPGSGYESVNVSASLTRLTVATTYHFRIVATNAYGTGKGAGETFTTEPPTIAPRLLSGEQGAPGSHGALPPVESKKPPKPEAELASTALTASSSGTIILKVSCPAAEGSCSGTITLRTLNTPSASAHRSKKPTDAILTLAAGSFKVTGGQVTSVKLHLSGKARTLLARRHVLHAQATIITRDPAGVTYTANGTLTIRPARAAHPRKA